MTQGKIVAIITGAISIIIAIAYLILVQILDFRGEMLPAPIFDSSATNYHIVADLIIYEINSPLPIINYPFHYEMLLCL